MVVLLTGLTSVERAAMRDTTWTKAAVRAARGLRRSAHTWGRAEGYKARESLIPETGSSNMLYGGQERSWLDGIFAVEDLDVIVCLN